MPVIKNPLDLWVYQEIVWDLRPTLIIETGTAYGGSALYFARQLDRVGAGTVLNEAQLARAIDAGSQFIVSPGLTNPLALAARDTAIPFLPGIATAADIMRGLDLGLDRFKFFPAEAAGGIAALKALSAPFGNARFCPTGGIRADTAGDWLAVPSVLCVGGSWLVKSGERDFSAVGERARAAVGLGRG